MKQQQQQTLIQPWQEIRRPGYAEYSKFDAPTELLDAGYLQKVEKEMCETKTCTRSEPGPKAQTLKILASPQPFSNHNLIEQNKAAANSTLLSVQALSAHTRAYVFLSLIALVCFLHFTRSSSGHFFVDLVFLLSGGEACLPLSTCATVSFACVDLT
jgi:hypothetical protein